MSAPHLNQPRLAALALARTIRHYFPERRTARRRACLPIQMAEIIEHCPPRRWGDLAVKNPPEAVKELIRQLEGLKELAKSIRRCCKLANRVKRCGTVGLEYALLSRVVLRAECVQAVDLCYESDFEADGDLYIPCEINISPPMATAADQMAELAGTLVDRTPAPAPGRNKGRPNARAGRPRTVTPELRREAEQLKLDLGTWALATEELNRRYPGHAWKPGTVEGWGRQLRRKERTPKHQPKAI